MSPSLFTFSIKALANALEPMPKWDTASFIKAMTSWTFSTETAKPDRSTELSLVYLYQVVQEKSFQGERTELALTTEAKQKFGASELLPAQLVIETSAECGQG